MGRRASLATTHIAQRARRLRSRPIQRLHTTSELLRKQRNPIEVVDVVLHQDSVPLVLGWQLSRVTRALLLRQVPKPLQCTPDSKRTNDSNECAIGRVLAILSSTAQSNSRGVALTRKASAR